MNMTKLKIYAALCRANHLNVSSQAQATTVVFFTVDSGYSFYRSDFSSDKEITNPSYSNSVNFDLVYLIVFTKQDYLILIYYAVMNLLFELIFLKTR